jgi:hypothetical protein
MTTKDKINCIMQVAITGENLRKILEWIDTKELPEDAASWLSDLMHQSDCVRRWISGESVAEPSSGDLEALPKSLFPGRKTQKARAIVFPPRR